MRGGRPTGFDERWRSAAGRCHPPTGGTSRHAQNRPRFATAQDAVARFLLDEASLCAAQEKPFISAWDANAIRDAHLDAVGTVPEPREESALCRAVDEGGLVDIFGSCTPRLVLVFFSFLYDPLGPKKVRFGVDSVPAFWG